MGHPSRSRRETLGQFHGTREEGRRQSSGGPTSFRNAPHRRHQRVALAGPHPATGSRSCWEARSGAAARCSRGLPPRVRRTPRRVACQGRTPRRVACQGRTPRMVACQRLIPHVPARSSGIRCGRRPASCRPIAGRGRRKCRARPPRMRRGRWGGPETHRDWRR